VLFPALVFPELRDDVAFHGFPFLFEPESAFHGGWVDKAYD
jgi:hypothetical protein